MLFMKQMLSGKGAYEGFISARLGELMVLECVISTNSPEHFNVLFSPVQSQAAVFSF